MCLTIGHIKTINFPFGSIGLSVPIHKHFQTHKTINFPFGTNGNLLVLGTPILKRIRTHKKH